MSNIEKMKFNWKLPLYGIIGFALGSIILIAVGMGFENISREARHYLEYWSIITIIGFVIWGAVGGSFLGFGLSGLKDKQKILYLTFAGAMGLPLGYIAAVFLLGSLYGFFGSLHDPLLFGSPIEKTVLGFAIWLAIAGMFIGLALKNMKYTIYLLCAGTAVGFILGIITGGIGISDTVGMVHATGMSWFLHFLVSSIIIGGSFSLSLAYITRKSIGEDKDPKGWLFVAAVVSGLAVVLIINLIFPPNITEDVGCCGKIITTNKFQVNMQSIYGAGFYPYTYLEYEYKKDGRTFENFFFNDMRLSLDWIGQNTENDSIFLNWWDYGHHIRGYADRDSVIYAPSEDMLRTLANMKWIPEKQGDFSSRERIVDVGYVLLTSNPDETLRIMDKYNANYLYIHHTDLGKSWAMYEAVKDDVGSKLAVNISEMFQIQPTQEEMDEVEKKAKDEDEKSKLMNELDRKKKLEMLENTTLEKALNKKEIEGLKLVYFDKVAVIYKKI